MMAGVQIRALDPAKDLQALRSLWHEYLAWGVDQLAQHYALGFGDADAMVAADLAHLDSFAPPQGCLFLAEVDGGVMGSVALRPSSSGVAEIKRLYVRPAARGLGLGQLLVSAALQRAREASYSMVRLDSARFMTAAHALYRQHGFTDTEPYAESEVPPAYWQHWLFMQCPLQRATRG